jgi:polysaccharide biosynthesis protein VpsM
MSGFRERRRRTWWIMGVLLVFLWSGSIWAQGAAPSPPEPEEVEKEAPAPAPVPEKERPPEISPRSKALTYVPPPSSFTLAQDLGPTTGLLAPYGNATAMDTLGMGWQSHRLGALSVTPFMEYMGVYRTNIYQTSTDKITDYINVINPGMKIEMPLGQNNKISVGYLGNYYIYSRHEQDTHYDHNINGDIVWNFPGGLGFQLGNTFRSATEERNASTGRQRPYDRETPYFVANYRLSDKWKLQGTYQFDSLQFADVQDYINNYDCHTAGLSLYYKFWPKTAAFIQYLASFRTYPFFPLDNNQTQAGLVGLTWDPTAKLTGTAKVGFTIKSYEHDLPVRDNAPASWAMSVQTIYRYSQYITFTLNAQHSIQEDVDSDNSPYRNTGLFLTMDYQWQYLKSVLYFAAAYSNNSYVNETLDFSTNQFKRREDNIVSLGTGISRPLTRWLKIHLDYQYLNKSSNISGFSFNEHRVIGGLQTSF